MEIQFQDSTNPDRKLTPVTITSDMEKKSAPFHPKIRKADDDCSLSDSSEPNSRSPSRCRPTKSSQIMPPPATIGSSSNKTKLLLKRDHTQTASSSSQLQPLYPEVAISPRSLSTDSIISTTTDDSYELSLDSHPIKTSIDLDPNLYLLFPPQSLMSLSHAAACQDVTPADRLSYLDTHDDLSDLPADSRLQHRSSSSQTLSDLRGEWTDSPLTLDSAAYDPLQVPVNLSSGSPLDVPQTADNQLTAQQLLPLPSSSLQVPPTPHVVTSDNSGYCVTNRQPSLFNYQTTSIDTTCSPLSQLSGSDFSPSVNDTLDLHGYEMTDTQESEKQQQLNNYLCAVPIHAAANNVSGNTSVLPYALPISPPITVTDGHSYVSPSTSFPALNNLSSANYAALRMSPSYMPLPSQPVTDGHRLSDGLTDFPEEVYITILLTPVSSSDSFKNIKSDKIRNVLKNHLSSNFSILSSRTGQLAVTVTSYEDQDSLQTIDMLCLIPVSSCAANCPVSKDDSLFSRCTSPPPMRLDSEYRQSAVSLCSIPVTTVTMSRPIAQSARLVPTATHQEQLHSDAAHICTPLTNTLPASQQLPIDQTPIRIGQRGATDNAILRTNEAPPLPQRQSQSENCLPLKLTKLQTNVLTNQSVETIDITQQMETDVIPLRNAVENTIQPIIPMDIPAELSTQDNPINFSSSQTQFPVILQPANKHNTFKPLQTEKIWRDLESKTSYVDQIDSLTLLRSGGLLLRAKNAITQQDLLKMTSLTNVEVTASLTKSDLTCRGVIADIHPDTTAEYIKEHISAPGFQILHVSRLLDPEKKMTQAAITFAGQMLPKIISCDKSTHAVRPYYETPNQCKNCFRYAHLAKQCRSLPICLYCAGPKHADNICPSQNRNIPPKCSNCAGNHTATNFSCPARCLQVEILKYRNKHKVSFTTAKDFVHPKGLSYSAALHRLRVNSPNATVSQTQATFNRQMPVTQRSFASVVRQSPLLPTPNYPPSLPPLQTQPQQQTTRPAFDMAAIQALLTTMTKLCAQIILPVPLTGQANSPSRSMPPQTNNYG